MNSQRHGVTRLGLAVRNVPQADRIIVITDEQSSDSVGAPQADKGYMINVASNQNGVGYGDWIKVNGWSDAIISYIQKRELLNDKNF